MTKLLILNDAQKATFDGLPSYDEDPAFPFDIDSLAAEGKHVYRFAGPVSGTVTEVVLLSSVVGGGPSDGDSASDTSKTFTLPTIPADCRVALIISCSGTGTGAGGTIAPHASSAFIGSQRGLSNDGDASYRGKMVLYSFTHAEWVAAGSPTTVTITSSAACYMAAGAVCMNLISDVVGTPVFATGDDIGSVDMLTSASRVGVWAHTRTRHDAVMTDPPSGYSNTHRSRIGSTSSGVTGVDRTLFVASKVLSAQTEDPGTPTMGSPSGVSKMSVFWPFG